MSDVGSRSRSRIQNAGLIAGPVVATLVYALLPHAFVDSAGLNVTFTNAGRATMALMAWMAIWWLTEAIDISATALVPIVLLPLTGAATIKQATAPYGSDLIFLFMGGFMLALSMQRWGLDKRIALVTLRIVGSRPRNMVAGFMIATAMISAFVSNTATAAMMLPVGLSVISLLKSTKSSPYESQNERDDRNFGLCLMLGIAYAASIGGLMTIIGSPPNVFVVGFVRDSIDPAYRTEIPFIRWMAFGVPLAMLFLPVTWFLLTRVLYPIRVRQIEGGHEFIRREYRNLGPIKRGEWITMIVFFSAALLWIVRPVLAKGWRGALPLSDAIPDYIISPLVPGLEDAGVAMLAALVLFIIPVNWRQRTFTMNWDTASKLPWGILILFGGGLSLAAAIEANGVAEFIGSQTRQFAGVPPIILVLLVTTAVIFFSELASNTATATTLVPILAAMAPGLDVHPYLLVIPAGIAASCAFMMPVGTPPNAIVFGSGYVTMSQMIKAGIWLNLIGIALIMLISYLIAMPMMID